MSTNCIRCLVNERAGLDLLCDDCRPNPTPKLTAEERLLSRAISQLRDRMDLLPDEKVAVVKAFDDRRRKVFEEAAEAVRNACKQCDRPIKTRVIGHVVKGGQRLPVHQLDDNLIECLNCGPATAAIRALAKEQADGT